MSVERHLPQLSELKPLMQFGKFNPDRRAARLAKAADIEALRAIARRRTPKPAFDYVDGAAGLELTYKRSREAFESVELLPKILHGTAEADLSTGPRGKWRRPHGRWRRWWKGRRESAVRGARAGTYA